MVYAALGGNPNNTNGSSGYWPSQVLITEGYGFAAGNLDRSGKRPVWLDEVVAFGVSGVSDPRIGYKSVISSGGTLWPDANGGQCSLRLYFSGTIGFGRNTGNGLVTVEESTGYTWGGGLTGGFYWATVPTTPRDVSLSRVNGRQLRISFNPPSWNGDGGISGYTVQLQRDGGSWGTERTIGDDYTWDITAVPGSTYRARISANNPYGSSAWVQSGTVFIPPAGKRMTGASSSTGLSVGRRMTSSTAYKDLTIGKRFNGSSWVDFSA